MPIDYAGKIQALKNERDQTQMQAVSRMGWLEGQIALLEGLQREELAAQAAANQQPAPVVETPAV